MTLTSQPTPTPTRKVTAAAIAGTITAAVLWAITAATGTDVPEPIAAAVTLAVSLVCAYVVKDRTITLEGP